MLKIIYYENTLFIKSPLDYKAGIPSYCLNLYSGKNFNVLNLSYDLNNTLSKSKKEFLRVLKR